MTRQLLITSIGLILVSLYTQAAFTQSSVELESLKKEIEGLKEGQRTLQRELEAIKNLFRGRQAPLQQEYQNLILSVDGNPFTGDKNAPLTIVEFSDYQCPFCARHFKEVFPKIESDYIKTGKVKYVFRDFPITFLSRDAFKAGEAAGCASEQGKYWEMHAQLFTNQHALEQQNLLNYAKFVGLDLAKFGGCLNSGRHAPTIDKNLVEGERAGVSGIPTFFIARTEPSNEKIKVLRIVRGAQPYASFREVLDSLLERK